VGGPGGVTKHEPRRLSWFVFAIHDTTTSGGNDKEVVGGGKRHEGGKRRGAGRGNKEEGEGETMRSRRNEEGK